MLSYKSSPIVLSLFVSFLTLFVSSNSLAGETSEEHVATIVSIEGNVEIQRTGETRWGLAQLNDILYIGDTIRTGENSRAAFVLLKESTKIRLGQRSWLVLERVEKESFLLKLLRGVAYFFSRTPRRFKVDTAFLNGSVEGTEFYVMAEKEHTILSVLQGQVRAANEMGSVVLASGQSAIAEDGKAPEVSITVRPRDAVQWALYYPTILNYQPADFQNLEENLGKEKIQKSIELYRAGDIFTALSGLVDVPEDIKDPRFYTYRAGLLLTVGRVDKAGDDIEAALKLNQSNSHAFALKSIIAMVQNRKDQSLELAKGAVSLDPRSPEARVALSYSQQAHFDLEGALDSLKKAVKLDPENALALARLSEIWLSLGHMDNALETAQKAAALNPNLARTQTVLGFAYIAQVKTVESRNVFEKAIRLDQADPLPRLGLGLAKIRDGELEEGRQEIETAVALDPNNSLIRSYLGKAYFEEKRTPLDEEQFKIAKELDPMDPTSYFYDAIRKQTMNRPVEALHDLQKSIELNDNRAVYRSRLLLDEDLAARSASLGRIYSDLGFQQLALVEGWKSVNADPTNFSAHRFLADSYSILPRHEIARVSELLQSQLRQPINIMPVQPSLAQSNLLILEGTGPSNPSFNEFNPLFNRNRFSLQTSGIVGGDDTFGEEIVQSGVWNRTSYSVGAFHYDTDGFRENSDQERDIYNVFVQTGLSSKTNMQAEVRYEKIEKGDLRLRFDPGDILTSLRENTDTYSIRLGFHHEFSPESGVTGSFIYRDWESTLEDQKTFINILSEWERDGFNGEIQHFFNSEVFTITSGFGYYHEDSENIFAYTPSPMPPDVTNNDIDHTNIYVYSLINYPKNIVWSVGGSSDFYEGGIRERDQFNPKFGFIWDLSEAITLRGAIFRTFKRSLVSNQTIEPTQVAGFNQFFDDAEATEAWRYGLAIDEKFSSYLFGGIEFTQRDLDVPYWNYDFSPIPPAPPIITIEDADWEERLTRAYLCWTPHKWFSASLEFHYELLNRDEEWNDSIRYIKTYRLPFRINFYHPSGFIVRLKATYISQKGNFYLQDHDLGDPFVTGNDKFCVVDGSVSYRLPRRLGMISVEAKNLFNKSFKYYDTDYANPLIQPESLLLLRITMAF